ncbi:HECT domain-containing protein [Pseudoscourfieldia marina]
MPLLPRATASMDLDDAGDEDERWMPSDSEVKAAELSSAGLATPSRLTSSQNISSGEGLATPTSAHHQLPPANSLPAAAIVTPRPLLRSNTTPASLVANVSAAAAAATSVAAPNDTSGSAFDDEFAVASAFAVGCSSSGQLGTGSVADRNATVMALVGVRQWAAVDFGDAHAAGVSESGDVYAWGSFELGQLGGAQSVVPQEERSAGMLAVPRRVQALDGMRALAVSCGGDHTAVVVEGKSGSCSAGGELITWGCDEHGACGHGTDATEKRVARPRVVPALKGISVVQVACGATHTLVVTAGASVFAWGGNAEGQLGVGHCEDVRSPIELGELWGVPVVRVAAGGAHSACITAAGSLLAWGSNRRGELGIPESADTADDAAAGTDHAGGGPSSPSAKRRRTYRVNQKMLEHLLEMGLSRAEAECALGETGSVAVEVALEWHFEHGAAAAAAAAASKAAAASTAPASTQPSSQQQQQQQQQEQQLRRSLVPRRVAGIRVATHVALGASHTALVASTADGRHCLYTCGLGRDGALGHGILDDERTPRAVAFFEAMDVIDVACGSQHTLVLASPTAGGPANVYGFGSTEHGQLGAAFGVSSRQSNPVALFPIWFKSTTSHKQGACSAGGQSSCVLMVDAVTAEETAVTWESGPARAVTELRETLLRELREASSAQEGTQEETRAVASILAALSSAAAVSMRFGQLAPEMTSNVDAMNASVSALAATKSSHGSTATGALGVDFRAVEAFYKAVLSTYREKVVHALVSGIKNIMDEIERNYRRFFQSGSQPMYSERVRVLLVLLQSPLVDLWSSKNRLAGLCMDQAARLFHLVAHLPMTPCKSFLIKWLAEYDADILASRVLRPLQDYITRRLDETRQVDQGIVDAVRVMHIVERANQLSEALPMEAFYNDFVSEKINVKDDYLIWRDSEESAEDEGGASGGSRVPFTFCRFPFLLNTTTKRRILEMESKVRMSETVQRSRFEHMFGDADFFGEWLFGISGMRGSRRDDEETVGRRKEELTQGCGGGGGGGGGESSTAGRLASRSAANTPFTRAERRALGDTPAGEIPAVAATAAAASGVGSETGTSSALPRANTMNQPAPHLSDIPPEHPDVCVIRVRRDHIITDALDEVARQKPMDLFKPLRVHFIGEEGVDAGGVQKEFFALLCEELTNSQLFEYHEETRLYWFRPDQICSGAPVADSDSATLDPEFLAELTLVGICFGLAIYNQNLLGIPFPIAAYKLLLDSSENCPKLSLKDLENLSPTTASSLRSLLYYDETPAASVEDVFCLTFTAGFSHFGEHIELPLIVDGSSIAVTASNRHEYVDRYVNFVLIEGVQKQWSAFHKGFQVMCDGKGVSLLRPRELEALVNGTTRLDFGELKANAKYEAGYSESTPVVRWLWEILEGTTKSGENGEYTFPIEARRKFLKFVTGCDRSPVGGLRSMRPPITVQRDGGAQNNKLPTSHTCFNYLLLPDYESKAILYERLVTAIENASEGFGLR